MMDPVVTWATLVVWGILAVRATQVTQVARVIRVNRVMTVWADRVTPAVMVTQVPV
jgi:hypothetical protein